MIKTMDNILNVPDDFLSANLSSARILRAFELQLTFPQDNIVAALDNIAVQVLASTPTSLDDDGIGYGSVPVNGRVDNSLMNNDGVVLTSGDARAALISGVAEASIGLPPEVFARASKCN